jgi:hypothetical protein
MQRAVCIIHLYSKHVWHAALYRHGEHINTTIINFRQIISARPVCSSDKKSRVSPLDDLKGLKTLIHFINANIFIMM